MSKLFAVLALATFCSLAAACGDSDDSPGGGTGGTGGSTAGTDGCMASTCAGGPGTGGGSSVDHLVADASAADGDAYYAALMASDYQSFAAGPGYETPQPTQGRHGMDVLIYINSVMEGALDETGLFEWPDGSLVVKDGFDADGNLASISSLEKYEGEWYFAEYDGDGATLSAGLETAACRGCHHDGNDAILIFQLP